MKNSIYQELQSTFYSTSSLGSCSTISPTSSPKYLSCLQQLDIPTILSQQDNFINYGTAYLLDPSVGSGEPIRPHVDGSLVTSSLTTSYPSVKKPLLITSNRDDAGQAIGGYYPADWDISNFAPTVEGSLGQQRSNVLLPSPYYNPDPSLSPPLVQPYINNGDQTRQALSRLGTDQLWRYVVLGSLVSWQAWPLTVSPSRLLQMRGLGFRQEVGRERRRGVHGHVRSGCDLPGQPGYPLLQRHGLSRR